MQRGKITIGTGFVALALGSGLVGAWLRPAAQFSFSGPRSVTVRPSPARGYVAEGAMLKIATGSRPVIYGWGPLLATGIPVEGAIPLAFHPAAEHALYTPTSLNWRRPSGAFPQAAILWLSEQGPDGRWSMPSKHTFTTVEHGELAVMSLTAHPGAWSDPDSGLLVVGHGIFSADSAVLEYYANDPRWWKYPGNFHGRGKDWERSAHVELFDRAGALLWEAPVTVRMNGQMTRGFPQHAFRLLFEEPLQYPLFGDGEGIGSRSLVLRAAGNDQVKAMMRDAYQHALCRDLPFASSRSLSCVVYLNGAYWGVHHLRQRMDEHELARRYGVKKGKMAVLEDRARIVNGDSTAVKDFLRLVYRARTGDPERKEWLDEMNAELDLNGFLTYMASQMILGNMDWPRQNVKYWRYTGKPQAGTDLDGRWRFIMGDSDLSFGANAPVGVDLFKQVKLANAPVSALFMGLYRSSIIRERFLDEVASLLDGPLSAERCVSQLDSMVHLMAPEMDRHTRRWRKPVNVDAWRAEVEVMRNYALRREASCRSQLRALQAERPTP
jgi:hypothetical protein